MNVLSFKSEDVHEHERLFSEYHRDFGAEREHRTKLDDQIQMTIQRMSFAVSDSEKRTYSGDRKCYKKINIGGSVRRILPLIVLIGYFVYLGFALYLNPSQSVFVCVVAVFVIYICLNILTGGRIRQFVRRVATRLKKCMKIRNRRVSIWARR